MKSTVLWTYVTNDVDGEEIVGTFYEKKEFRFDNVIKRKSDKLYVKWKRYKSLFISWIHKKDIL